METQPKIGPTSIKNLTIINQTSTKITAGAKNVAHIVLGAVLGAVLEASWKRLGSVLGANIVPSWRLKPKENRSKIHAKINKKIDAF